MYYTDAAMKTVTDTS